MLAPRKKITKKEIKEDPLVTYYINLRKFLTRHQKYINYGLMGLFVLIITMMFMSKSKKDAEKQASADIAILEQQMYSEPADHIVQEVIRISKNYSGTFAAGRATYLIANAYLEKENFEEAKKYYEKYLDNYNLSTLFDVSAISGLAACYEHMENMNEAARLYEKAFKDHPDFFLTPYNLMSAARCYLAIEDTVQSKKLYKKVIDQFTSSSVVKDAELMFHLL